MFSRIDLSMLKPIVRVYLVETGQNERTHWFVNYWYMTTTVRSWFSNTSSEYFAYNFRKVEIYHSTTISFGFLYPGAGSGSGGMGSYCPVCWKLLDWFKGNL